MEFRHLLLFTCVLFSFALATHASLPDEDYWKTVWPKTPIPGTLQELLKSDLKGDEINNMAFEVDDTQYPKTVFLQRDLYPGKIMNLQFTNFPFSHSAVKALIPVEEIKEKYTFQDICLNETIVREDRYCVKSLGALVDFVVKSKLGKNVHMLSSSFVNMQKQYTVKGVQNLGTKAVACHRLNFQNTVYFCHEFIDNVNVFMVSLGAGDGTTTEALAVCHASSLCHFPEDKAVLWVPNSVVNNAFHRNYLAYLVNN